MLGQEQAQETRNQATEATPVAGQAGKGAVAPGTEAQPSATGQMTSTPTSSSATPASANIQTTVEETPLKVRVRAPVIHEVVRELEEVRVTPVIRREIVRPEIQQIIQPIQEVVRLETVVERFETAEQVREMRAEVPPLDQTAVKTEIARLQAEAMARGTKEEKFLQMPAQITESVRNIRIEETIPVRVGATTAPNLADQREIQPGLLESREARKESLASQAETRAIGTERMEGTNAEEASAREPVSTAARSTPPVTVPTDESKIQTGQPVVAGGSVPEPASAASTSATEMRRETGTPSNNTEKKTSVVDKVKNIFS